MWNGRLDNRAELALRFRDMLVDTSDIALVRAAYERDGIQGLRHLIGDWSVVIHDPHADLLILASDFAGIRPLYYCEHRGAIYWSSTLDALVERTGTEALDERYIAGFMVVGGYPGLTPYREIRSVPPGHAVSIDARSTCVRSFWSMPSRDTCRYDDSRRYEEQFYTLFREAVAVRLQSSHGVLAELSGGFDSSSVVCMANDLIRSGAVSPPSFGTVSYISHGSLDIPFIEDVERACGVQGIHLSTATAPLFSALAPAGASPHGRPPIQQAVAALARERGVKTLLTGQAGDLLLGNWIDDSLQVARFVRRGRFGRACREALEWSKATRSPVPRILTRALVASLPFGRSSRFQDVAGVCGTDVEQCSLQSALLQRTGLDDVESVFSTEWMHGPIERRQHFMALTTMRELRSLQPLDVLGGLNYAHPFAHRPLVEFLTSVPAEVLCRPDQPRRLMHLALSGLWPPRLRNRRSKALFTRAYFEAFRPFAAALLREKWWHVVEHGWVDRRGLIARLERFCHGLECNQVQLRQILLLENWLQQRAARLVAREVVDVVGRGNSPKGEARHGTAAQC